MAGARDASVLGASGSLTILTPILTPTRTNFGGRRRTSADGWVRS